MNKSLTKCETIGKRSVRKPLGYNCRDYGVFSDGEVLLRLIEVPSGRSDSNY